MDSLLLKKCLEYLKKGHVFIQFPLSVLLWGLEVLAEINFSCPCNVKINYDLAVTMFCGPFFFILAVMFFLFRPFKQGCFHCPKTANVETNDEANQSWLISFLNCLIPPVMWVVILLLDGDYVICGRTDWNGHYVFDEELNKSWCKPTEEMRNEAELRGLTTYNLHYSQWIGYILIGILGSVLVILLGLYDCCITGKYDWCPNKILKTCGRTDTEQGTETGNNNDSLNLSATVSSTPQVIQMEKICPDQSQTEPETHTLLPSTTSV